MFIRLQRPVLRPRCGESPRAHREEMASVRSDQPWDSTFTLYACRLHKILVNKDLCITLNAHKISNSKYFSIFFSGFFVFILTFCSCHLFVGQDLLRILRCSNKLPRVSFFVRNNKSLNLNTVNSTSPIISPYFSPPSKRS